MAYVTVPKDLTKVKSKVVFGLTKRQLICFGGALLVGVPLFFLIRGRVPTSAAALIMVFAMLPGFLLALYERHGQPLEVVVWQIVECCFIQPKERPTRPTTLIPPLCGNPKWKRRSTPLSKKQKNETSAKAPVKLTRAEKKEIQAVIRKYKGDGKPHSAQASIPYEAMYQDGVCRVTPRTFSKCIEFTDISYQLAQADTKTAIFENLCDLYNYLDASIHVQFSFINRKIDPKQYAKSFEIRAQGDDFDDIRSEYSDILQDQLVNGNNGLMKRKFMTYTIEADSLKMARARLRRIETDLLGYFKSMGASAWGLDAKERLEVMHSIFHPDGEPFSFDWKWLAPSGLSTKDFIAPSSFRFGNARMFGLGGKYGAVSFLQILSPELSDEMLADFLNTENGIVVNLHVQAIDQSEAIKTVKRKITDLDAMKIQEQKRAVRSGYDMDILPSDLATYGQDAKELLKTLQSRNERMFQLTFWC